MRRILLSVVVVLGGAVMIAYWLGLLNFNINTGTCRNETEVDAATRDAAANAARAFYDTLLKPDTRAAYAMIAAPTRVKVPFLQFEDVARQIIARGPYNDFRVARSYHPTLTGSKEARVMCGAIAGSQWVSVAALPNAEQAHVIMHARTRNNGWAFNAWLVKNGAAWEVYGFYTAMSDMVGHDAANLLALAREQDKRGHAFNAHMLYVAATSTVDRGVDLQLSVKSEAENGLSAHTVPPELRGDPPFTWQFGGTDKFTVQHVAIVGVDNALALIIQHIDPAWSAGNDADAEARNRRFIDALVKAHPELKESFGFLVAQITAPGQPATFGTVYDTAKGYLPDKPGQGKPAPNP
jgi:hypothetical protein